MTGRLSGVAARIKEVAPESESTHCIIHREMLAGRKMSSEFNNVLNDVVKVINHIKAHTLNSCLFEQLCEEKAQSTDAFSCTQEQDSYPEKNC